MTTVFLFLFLYSHENTDQWFQGNTSGRPNNQKCWSRHSFIWITWQFCGSRHICGKHGRDACSFNPWRHVSGDSLWVFSVITSSIVKCFMVFVVFKPLFYGSVRCVGSPICCLAHLFLAIYSKLSGHGFGQCRKYLFVSENVAHVGGRSQRKSHWYGGPCSRQWPRRKLRKTSPGHRKTSENGCFAGVPSTRGS